MKIMKENKVKNYKKHKILINYKRDQVYRK